MLITLLQYFSSNMYIFELTKWYGKLHNIYEEWGIWYLINTVASFSCDSGYYQYGPNSRTCETSGKWNELNPICEGFPIYSAYS